MNQRKRKRLRLKSMQYLCVFSLQGYTLLSLSSITMALDRSCLILVEPYGRRNTWVVAGSQGAEGRAAK